MSCYQVSGAIKKMLGRKLKAVVLEPSKDFILFTFQDGGSQRFGVEGDCCSYSWIEHLECPLDVDGATLLAVEDSDKITQDHDEHDDNAEGGGEIQVYNTSFKTDRGEIILEYRNSSNGYYGGYLVTA